MAAPVDGAVGVVRGGVYSHPDPFGRCSADVHGAGGAGVCVLPGAGDAVRIPLEWAGGAGAKRA